MGADPARTVVLASHLLEQLPGLQQLCGLDAKQHEMSQHVTQRLVEVTYEILRRMVADDVATAFQQFAQDDIDGIHGGESAIDAPPRAAEPRPQYQLGEGSVWWHRALLHLNLWEQEVRSAIIDWLTSVESDGSTAVASCLHALLIVSEDEAESQQQALLQHGAASFVASAFAILDGILEQGAIEQPPKPEV